MTAELTRTKLAAQTTRKSLATKSLPPLTSRWTLLTMKLWIQNAHRLSLSNLIASAGGGMAGSQSSVETNASKYA